MTGTQLNAATLARWYAHDIAAHYWPEAVISHRSALKGGYGEEWLFLTHPEPVRKADVVLPGVTLSCIQGLPPLPGDMPLPSGLYLASDARQLLENADTGGRPPAGRPARAAGMEAVGDKIAELSATGDQLLNTFAVFDQIRGRFPAHVAEAVYKLLTAASGTYSGEEISSSRLGALVSGTPYDQSRVELFEQLAEQLHATAPSVSTMVGPDSDRQWLPFFEAYFSNYIEGTRFEVEEARDIAIHGITPKARPADARDVAATYALVNDDTVMGTIPKDADEFLELLRTRHAILMAGRSDKSPGVFKQRRNYAGLTEFVHPDYVEGTLREGFARINQLLDPFHRAVMMMLVVTECHPFDDGNGRLARIMTNAELASQRQHRIIIPTAFRNDYIAALNGATVSRTVTPLVSVMDFARRWVAAVDWADWDTCMEQLHASNAFVESAIAEKTGQRLRLPQGF